jgi:two-component system, chemotaxis family, protein-glutamate methylesterase/glutaminase
MANRDIVVIGASAGGIPALVELVKHLPANLKASVFVVLHISPNSPSQLPQIITRSGYLKAIHPRDDQVIEQGIIYVAPPNYHMLVEDDHILVKKGPKENRFRPSIDALFRSAAYNYKTRVIGVILSGMLDDGTSGMWSVKRMGGLGIIQAPEDALCSSMPINVMEYVKVDYSVPVTQIGYLIKQLTNKPAPDKPELDPAEIKRLETEIKIAAQKNAFEIGLQYLGNPTLLTCPECNGSLVQFKEGSIIRYRCHTGHAFTQDSFMANASKAIEEKLWQAVRSLEELVIILEEMAKHYEQMNMPAKAQQFYTKAQETRKRASCIHEYIFEQENISDVFINAEGTDVNKS